MIDFILTTAIPFLIGMLLSSISVYLTMKYRPRGQINFVITHYIPLLDQITQDLPDLEIMYKGSPITKNLILIEGFLENSGYLDVSKEDIKRPICFVVPDGYTVREVTFSDNPPVFNTIMTASH